MVIPFNRRAKGLTFEGDILTNFAVAFSVILRLFLRLFSMKTVFSENSSRGKFTQPVTDHVFSDKDLDMRFAVVDGKRMPDKIRNNH